MNDWRAVPGCAPSSLRASSNQAAVRYCIASSRPVFLNLDTERFFCLPSAAEAAFLARAGGTCEGALISAEGFGAGASLAALCDFEMPCRSLLEDHSVRPSYWLALMLIAERMRADRDLSRAPLAMIVAQHQACKQALSVESPALSSATASKLVQADRLCSRVMTSHDRCLPSSLALARVAIRTGLLADVVIGVSLRPFAAHAWVQVGDIVLNDSIEHVRQFTPILTT